jgi:hypothetical protein
MPFSIRKSTSVNLQTKQPFMSVYFNTTKVEGFKTHSDCELLIAKLTNPNRKPFCILENGTIIHQYYRGLYLAPFYYTDNCGEFLSKEKYRNIKDVKNYFEFTLKVN